MGRPNRDVGASLTKPVDQASVLRGCGMESSLLLRPRKAPRPPALPRRDE